MDLNGQVSKKRDCGAQMREQSDWHSDFCNIGAAELIQNDPRPTFLLDIGPHSSSDSKEARLIYCNDSLEGVPEVLERIQSLYSSNTVDGNHDLSSTTFRKWTLESARSRPTKTISTCKSFLRFIWTTVTIRARWNIVSGLPTDTIDDLQNVESHPISDPPSCSNDLDGVAHSQDSIQNAGRGLDWTYPDSSFQTTSHIEWVRNFDWGSTPLGEMKTWSDQLRLAANLLMADTSPAALYWGHDRNMIYNEAYLPIFFTKHPWGLGRPFEEVYSNSVIEHKDFYDSIWASGIQYGRATAAIDERFVMAMQNECEEEVFFSYRILPILGRGENIGGFYVTFQDVTRSILSSRRATTLRAAADANANGIDPETFWRMLVDTVSSNENDIASIFAYSIRGSRHGSLSPGGQMAETNVLEAFSEVPVDGRGCRVPMKC